MGSLGIRELFLGVSLQAVSKDPKMGHWDMAVC